MAVDEPKRTQTPEFVDQGMIIRCLEELGFHFDITMGAVSDRIEVPWPNHDLLIRFEDDFARVLCVDATMTGRVDLSMVNSVAELIADWNGQRVNPAAVLHIDDDGSIRVNFRSTLAVDRGASFDQVCAFLQITADASALASDLFGERFPELTQPRHSRKSTFDDVDALIDDSTPEPVDLERVRTSLGELGISKTQGDDVALLAWVNSILIGFFIESSPSLLVKGHWDSDLDAERDFMRCFLVCNEWNEDHITTKAFCTQDEQGLQLRVEYVCDTGAGLNDVQLLHNLSLAVHHILKCIDHLSREISGTPAVDWPE
ncbi:YbjN domain-containing protein [Corynebacterium sp. SCR221107]|uniref:YbjN domain-containing protein n=1 Tax=Corynebacterium sp. SCR221107 TaxID=3017361 RepID=UPI0022EC5994|nr:YbjN domain-containing protein [Corynebacterium sp. SCR221107]WBT07977.1 YbjN domain-containing protein [Corynebacterium sp. SCR221107]